MTIEGNKKFSESLCWHQVVIWFFTTQKLEALIIIYDRVAARLQLRPLLRVDAGMWFLRYFSKCPRSAIKASYKENKDLFEQ